jgi:hypothetical protein
VEMLTLSALQQEFLRRAEWHREDDRKFLEREHKARKDKEEREKKAQGEDRFEEVLIAVMATDQELTDFTVTLNTYDAATIEALQQNEQDIIKVREELTRLLDQAYVLPDGRKVFKTEDGLHVFDEHGVEVQDIDPETIEPWRPKWETFSAERNALESLSDERQQLFDYQTKLDEARERIEDKDEPLTHDALEDLKARLEKDRPEAVKRVLGEAPDPAAPSEEFDPSKLVLSKPQQLMP